MRHATTNTTQVVGLFGGGYVPEDHGPGLHLREPADVPGSRLPLLLCALLIGVTSAAGALAANRAHAPIAKLWQQNPPTILMKLPNAVTIDEAVY